MSYDLTKAAILAKTSRATDKLVLIILAHHTPKGSVYSHPSVETIEKISSLNEKTVRASLKRLIAEGLISDTGRRVGDRRQVKMFRLNLKIPENGYVEQPNLTGICAKGTQKRPPKVPKIGEQNKVLINNKDPLDLISNKSTEKTYMPPNFLDGVFRKVN